MPAVGSGNYLKRGGAGEWGGWLVKAREVNVYVGPFGRLILLNIAAYQALLHCNHSGWGWVWEVIMQIPETICCRSPFAESFLGGEAGRDTLTWAQVRQCNGLDRPQSGKNVM